MRVAVKSSSGRALSRQDWLLLSLYGAKAPVDRVRLQKTLFLFSMRSKVPAAEQYKFEPYLYGPFSFQLYPDLDKLVAVGWLRQEPLAGTTSPGYSLTAVGTSVAAQLAAKAPEARVRVLSDIREWVQAQSFRSLLVNVYRLYPTFAVKSVFRAP